MLSQAKSRIQGKNNFKPTVGKDEFAECRMFMTMLRLQFKHLEKRTAHICNEGKRANFVADAVGIKAGYPDYFVAYPRLPDYCGLYIEMKSSVGKLRENQLYWLQTLRADGYAATACWGAAAAIEAVKDYVLNHKIKDEYR